MMIEQFMTRIRRTTTSTRFIRSGCKRPQIKAESQCFNFMVIVSVQIQCAGVNCQDRAVPILRPTLWVYMDTEAWSRY